MASNTGKGKRKAKGKTMDLHSFLRDNQSAPEGFTIVNTTKTWAETMEDEELDDKFTLDYKKETPSSNKVILPTAPKAVRAPDVDLSKVPTKPPYKAYLGNLPYEVTEEDIIAFFRKLRVKNVQLPKEGGRLRGFGYAEFEDRTNLIEALSLNNETIKNRSIRVSLSSGDNDAEKPKRDDREDRTAGDWRNAPRDHLPPRDKEKDQRFTRDLRNGSDFDQFTRGGSNFERRTQDRFERGFERRNDRGFREDRDFERSHDRRNDRQDSRNDRRDFGSSFERRRPTQTQSRGASSPSPTPEPEKDLPKERPKLNLKPRTLPVDNKDEPATNSAIFGGAKPVDTAAREMEIEERLQREKEQQEKKEDLEKLSRPISQSPNERVRRISNNSNYSAPNRSRRGSETERCSQSSRDEFINKVDEPIKPRGPETTKFETSAPQIERDSRGRGGRSDFESRRENQTFETREFRSSKAGRNEYDKDTDSRNLFREPKSRGRTEEDEGYYSTHPRSGNQQNRNVRSINSGDRGFESGSQSRRNRPNNGRSNYPSKRGYGGSDNRTNSFGAASQNRTSAPKEKSERQAQRYIEQEDDKAVEYTSANKFTYLRDDFQDDVDGASH
ncbi:Eukaryotic translation initiation factor 4B-like protein [Dinothrombium tinctorium]|uniref:Eukaryotic translation initiation factor 4B-like protein n=1 Tax=Dinothrombium tinctorium TaxID=1965070 RepID=A0A443RDL2_9ACAR|nr:Eukaryotic translation initiation factor 4B-like protein [Dinothrombium tinctorium]